MNSMIALAIDLEHDNGKIIEIGLTEINLKKRVLGKTVSLLIKTEDRVSDHVYELTGLTKGKLNKGGMSLEDAIDKLFYKYGAANRLIVTDSEYEVPLIEKNWLTYCPYFQLDFKFSLDRINVGSLFKVANRDNTSWSLKEMLDVLCREEQQRPHRAGSDSIDISKVFLKLTENM